MRTWNDQTRASYSETLPSKSPNESDDQYIARLKQDAAQRSKALRRIDASALHSMSDRQLDDLMGIYRNTLRSLADRSFPMTSSLSPKAKLAARDYLYGQMAQIIRIAGKVETIQTQRSRLGNSSATGIPVRGSFEPLAQQKAKLIPFDVESKQVQQRTYATMKGLVRDSLEYWVNRPNRAGLIGQPSFDEATVKELVKQPKAKF